jgi:polyisoprenoid-binding protein YceI
MITNVRGAFRKLTGAVTYDPPRPEAARIEATLDVASVDTREPQRDAHLRSADFFDAERHPTMTFVSKSVERTDDGLRVVGDLTIRGTTKEVVLEVDGPTPEQRDPWGKRRVGASARTKIKRSDFGMTWNSAIEAGGVVVGDDVKIELDVSLVRDA